MLSFPLFAGGIVDFVSGLNPLAPLFPQKSETQKYVERLKAHRALLKDLSVENLEKYHEELESIRKGPDLMGEQGNSKSYLEDNSDLGFKIDSVSGYGSLPGMYMAPAAGSDSEKSPDNSQAQQESQASEPAQPQQQLPICILSRVLSFGVENLKDVAVYRRVNRNWRETLEYYADAVWARLRNRPVNLFTFARRGFSTGVIALLHNRVGFNPRNSRGESLLHVAASRGHIETVAILLELGVRPNAPDDEGKISLHIAAARGDAELIRLLIHAGADINQLDKRGCTAWYWAVIGNHPELKPLLTSKPKSDGSCCVIQ